MCGHFRKDQLNRTIISARQHRSPDLLGVILGMTLLLSTYPVYANTVSDKVPSISLIEMIDLVDAKPADGHEYVILNFQVIDAETSEPIPFVKIILMNENDEMVYGAVTDIDGFVKLKLTPDQMEAGNTLLFKSYDFIEKTIDWDSNWRSELLQTIELDETIYLIDGMMIMMPEEDSKEGRTLKRSARKQERRLKRMED
jgi:hypothetical protein